MKMKISAWAFLIAMFGSIILGLLSNWMALPTWLPIVFVALGIIIGIMNVVESESIALMVAALVLGAGSGVMTILPFIGGIVEAVLANFAAVMLPAGIVIAVKQFYNKAN